MKTEHRNIITGLSSYIGEFIGAIIKGFTAGFRSGRD